MAVLRGALGRGDLAIARCWHEEYGMKLSPCVLCEATMSRCEALMKWVAAVTGGCPGTGRCDGTGTKWNGTRTGTRTAAAGKIASMRCLRRLRVAGGAETLCKAGAALLR